MKVSYTTVRGAVLLNILMVKLILQATLILDEMAVKNDPEVRAFPPPPLSLSPSRGGKPGLLIGKYDHFTPARKMRRDVRLTASQHPEVRLFLSLAFSLSLSRPMEGLPSTLARRFFLFLTLVTGSRKS